MTSNCLKFTVKYSNTNFQINLPDDSTVSKLQKEIEILTNIPPKRQKYMIKGGTICDANRNIKLTELIKPDMTILLVGTPDSSLISLSKSKESCENIPLQSGNTDNGYISNEYLEYNEISSLSSQCSSSTSLIDIDKHLPVGIQNIGDTGCFNAVIQLLFRVSPIRELLNNYDPAMIAKKPFRNEREKSHHELVRALKRCFESLEDKTNKTIIILVLLNAVKSCYPQINQMDNDEQFNVTLLLEKLFQTFLIVFGGSFLNTLSVGFQTQYLSDGNDEDDTKKGKFEESIGFTLKGQFDASNTKLLDSLLTTLDTNEKMVRICRLPKTLFINIDRVSENMKNRLIFPLRLDISPIVEPHYLSDKNKVTQKIRDYEHGMGEQWRNDSNNSNEPLVLNYSDLYPKTLFDGENPSTLYNLIGIICHRGENFETNCYVTYTRDICNPSTWYKIDDDRISIVSKEKILHLDGTNGLNSENTIYLVYEAL